MKFMPLNLGFKIIFFSFIAVLYIILSGSILSALFDYHSSKHFSFDNRLEEFILGIIVAPIIETLIFQTGLINFGKVILKNSWATIILSGILFGLTHSYSIFLIILSSILGFYFSLLYIYFEKQIKNKLKTTIIVISIHSLTNLILFGIKHTF